MEIPGALFGAMFRRFPSSCLPHSNRDTDVDVQRFGSLNLDRRLCGDSIPYGYRNVHGGPGSVPVGVFKVKIKMYDMSR